MVERWAWVVGVGVVALALGSSRPVHADRGPDGVIVDGSISIGHLDDDRYAANDRGDGNVRLWAGYRFNPIIALGLEVGEGFEIYPVTLVGATARVWPLPEMDWLRFVFVDGFVLYAHESLPGDYDGDYSTGASNKGIDLGLALGVELGRLKHVAFAVRAELSVVDYPTRHQLDGPDDGTLTHTTPYYGVGFEIEVF